jgi:hypothetical protein
MSSWTKGLGRAAALSTFAAALSMSCTKSSNRAPTTANNAMVSDRTASDEAYGHADRGGQTANSQSSQANFANAGAPTPVQNTPPPVNREKPEVTVNSEAASFVAPQRQMNGPTPQSVEPAQSRSIDNKTAIDEIAAARCAREAECDKIGRTGRYKTQTDCAVDEQRSEFGDIGPKKCGKGIDRDKLDACVSGLRTEDCKGPMGAIPDLPACNASALCASY